ncbi:cytosine permease [Herbidospora sp. NEAU-GS84]|uniref:Cytosine permease n=1 Tax=Herbidospora solisilvae TaxID=2696284 RepID=A0A7C9NCB7_9ACTN|nr:cytosine permease [Herbidospora solisilvae]NAS20955.1 cytosine permease [Herbidospora solisilvae]
METHGVASMPEHRRTTRPRTVAAVLAGSNLSLSASVFGWLPVTYGLSWWQVVTATIAGTVLGLLMAAPLALLGYRSGTSSTVASGAFFGVRGRLLSSAIGMVLSLGYVAVAVWTAGEAVVAVVGGGDQPLVHLAIALVVTGLAVFGFDVLTRLNRWLIPVMAVTFTFGVVAFWDDFDVTWTAGPYVMDGAAGTWILALVTAGLSGPVAYVTMLGDFTRYVSPLRHRPGAVMTATAAGLFCGLVVPALFGAFLAIAARAGESYLPAVVAAAPGWYAPFILAGGVLGSLGAAGVPLYNMGLELHGMWPRLSRVTGTTLVAAATLGLLFLGRHTMQDAVTGFVVVLTVVTVPWAVIALIGHLRSGGYDVRDLQVHRKGGTGGRYWFTGGWNRPALLAWLAGAAVGLLDADSTFYTGPLVLLTGGYDVSYLLAGALSGGLYIMLSPREKQEPVPDWRQVYYWPAVRLPEGKPETGERQHAVATLEP